MKSEGVKERLGVNQRSLQSISPSILYLYGEKRKTCLWPTKYINALAESLGDNHDSRDRTNVLNFALSPEARTLIRGIRVDFNGRLNSKPKRTVDQVAELLGVGNRTVRDWLEAGVFTSTSESIRLRQGRGVGRIEVTHIEVQEIRNAFEWKLPSV